MKLEVGRRYYVETDTKHWVGCLVSEDGPFTVTLGGDKTGEVTWIAESGRFSEFLREGRTEQLEVEPLPKGKQMMVHWRNIQIWDHDLFKEAI